MNDWLRSLALVAMAFVAVVVATLGLSGVIVPQRPVTTGSAPDDEAPSGAPFAEPMATPGGIPGLGGALTVTGDYEGTVTLTSDSVAEAYSLEGDDARIVFGDGSPATVEQASFDGWQFFPDEGQCSLTPGNLDNAIGIGFAELRCDDLEEIRGKGTVSFAGEIGMPIDRLAARTLPPTGGELTVGEETWTIGESYLATWQQPMIGGVSDYNLVLRNETSAMDEDVRHPSAMNFLYDIETHRLAPATIERRGDEATIPDGACTLDRAELGMHNPRTTVIELTIECPAVDVPGLGTVGISGTVVVDELEWPE